MARPKGFHHSEETKAKMSTSQKGRVTSEEARVNMKKGHWTRKPNANSIKQKLREASVGNVPSEETRRKLSDAGRGHVLSAEARQTISEKAKARWARWRAACDDIYAINIDIGAQLPIGSKAPAKHSTYIVEKTSYHHGRRNWQDQHRVVMERHLGRTLTRDEHVHHIDGNGTNNSIDNLVLMTPGQHTQLNHALSLARNCDIRIAKAIIETLRKRFPELS